MSGPLAVRLALRLVVVVAVLMAWGCTPNNEQAPPDWQALRQEIRTRFPSVETISTVELAASLQRATKVRPLLLDARAPEEFAVSHLPEAILAPSVERAIEIIRAHDDRAPVVVYCSVGYQSADMVATGAGFHQRP